MNTVPLLDRLGTRIGHVAFQRLKAECVRRAETDSFKSSYGRIVTEALMSYLPPADDEQLVRKPAARTIARRKLARTA